MILSHVWRRYEDYGFAYQAVATWGCLATKVPCQTMKTAWFGEKQNSFLI